MYTATINEQEAHAILKGLYTNKQAMSVFETSLGIAGAKALLETLHNLTETTPEEFA